MSRQRVAFPSFRTEEQIKSYDMRQLVSALEYRFQSLEDNNESIYPEVGGGELDNIYAPLTHTHVSADITDLAVPTSIFDLDDVDGSPTVGEILAWNGAQFVPGPAGGTLALNDLTNVYVPAPSDGQSLVYVSGSGRWEAGDVAGGGGVTTLADLTDTEVSGQAQYDMLFNTDGTEWGNTAGAMTWTPGAGLDVTGDITVSGGAVNIYDSTGADYATLSHDGTDFNTTFINTTDWNVNDLTRMWLHDGAILRISDPTDLDWAEFNHDGTDFNTTFTNTTDWNISGISDVYIANDLANSPTKLFVGPTTLQGDSNDGHFVITGEHGGVLYGFKITQTSGTTSITGTTDGPATAASTTLAYQGGLNVFYQGGSDVRIQDGGTLRIQDTLDTDWAAFSHDGTDFNMDFTNTTDVSFTGAATYTFDEDIIVGLSGDPDFGKIYFDGASLHIDANGNSNLYLRGATVSVIGGDNFQVMQGGLNLTYNVANDGYLTMRAHPAFAEFAAVGTVTPELRFNGADLYSFDNTVGLSDNTLSRPELTDYGVTHQTPTVTANAVTVDLTLGNVATIDMDPATADVTLTLSNPPASGTYGEVQIYIVMGTPAYDMIWPGTIVWQGGGSAPTLTTTDDVVDMIHLSTNDGGTIWYGTYALNAAIDLTHTGEVTGGHDATVLDVTAITNRTDVVADQADDVAIHDDSDGTIKKVNLSSITDAGYF